MNPILRKTADLWHWAGNSAASPAVRPRCSEAPPQPRPSPAVKLLVLVSAAPGRFLFSGFEGVTDS